MQVSVDIHVPQGWSLDNLVATYSPIIISPKDTFMFRKAYLYQEEVDGTTKQLTWEFMSQFQ